jgi:hypothetical protein
LMKSVAENISNPQLKVTGPQGPIKLIVGKRSLMALVDKPARNRTPTRPLLHTEAGKNSSDTTFLLFARVRGRMIIWSLAQGICVSPSK